MPKQVALRQLRSSACLPTAIIPMIKHAGSFRQLTWRLVRLAMLLTLASPAVAQNYVTASPSNCCTVNYNGYSATVGASASTLPLQVTVTNPTSGQYNGSESVTVSLSGNGNYTSTAYAVFINGVGSQDTVDTTSQSSYAIGPSLTLNNSANISYTPPSYFSFGAPLAVQSTGADGYFQEANHTPPNSPVYNGASVGAMSITNAGLITVNSTVSGSLSGAPPLYPWATGILGSSTGGNGVGGKTNDNDIGGNGGNGGAVAITTNQGSQIILQGAGGNGSPLDGITAYSIGGTPGCRCSGAAEYQGSSGNGGPITITHNGSISSTAPNSIGISALSIGGNGGLYNGSGIAATPGMSGSGGSVNVSLGSAASINLTSGSAIGIVAASSVGPSDNSTTQYSGGAVTVTISQGASIASTGGGTFNIGVAAISTGSPNILEPFSTSSVSPNGSGLSGAVTVNNYGSINTNGQVAVGIAALSIGGSGVFTGASTGGVSTMGNTNTNPYAANVSANDVNVTNTGSIVTNGASAFGILAAANGSGGLINVASNAGLSGGTEVILGAQTATNNGNGGGVTVNNSGTITTGNGSGGGKLAIGILAQSIGGGGGSSGGGVAALVGDLGGNAGGGGAVNVTNTGQVTTEDNGAIGILAQSVGGGGGNGGNAAGVFVAVGGEGGSGGAGGNVTVNLNGGQIATMGNFAAGTIAQSIGGGGGNGGYATSAGLFVSDAIGGTGGIGGNGGAINFNNAATMTTQGQDSIGLLAQSVGGGGGNGGAAQSYAVGIVFTMNIAVGGSGNVAGAGGNISLTNSGNIITSGPDSIAVVGQSIGGGGGSGGASTAQTLAVSVPDVPTFSFTAAMGGSGKAGGNGGTVTIDNTGNIITTGDGAHGMLAQSIGGGGGNGGDSTAATHALAIGAQQLNFTIALGASGGAAGNGGAVNVYDGAFSSSSFSVGPVSVTTPTSAAPGGTTKISTGGANAPAIEAQSIGGGGGNSTAGDASNNSPNIGSSGGDVYQFNVGLGASGGSGGTGSTVNVAANSGTSLSTTGSSSPGILAQSISGGGGTSSGGSFGASVGSFTPNVSAGGTGVSGGNASSVTVANGGTITTTGGDSIGILAQSIAGGGGVVGSADASASIGTATQAENQINPPTTNSYSANVAIGGNGGGAGNGGQVQVGNSGAITTSGERAYGIEAQSIGGGGGNGATATAGADGSNNSTYAANVAVAGKGGAAGAGGNVTVYNSAAISTAGYNAYGILAQSIGGGGGVGGDGSVNADTTMSLGGGISGNGGAGGTGGLVTVQTATGGTVATSGDDASAILAQSIGGGGGTASAGCGSVSCLSAKGIATQVYNQTLNYSLNVGGNVGASGNGNTLAMTIGDSIQTTGARSMGVVAQSIGGGGGFATAASQNLLTTELASSPGGNGGTGGPVSVTLQSGATISTAGAGSWGILAQSVGGGGGFAGDPSLNISSIQSNTLPRTGLGDAYANTVNVTVNGNIITTGTNAHGIFAQSLGGSGGIVAGARNSTTSTLLAGNTAQFRGTSNATYYGDAGAINITQNAGSLIQTSGPGSIAIIAQSTGNSGGTNVIGVPNVIKVAVGGTVIGGTNTGYNSSNGGIGAAGILLSGGGGSSSLSNSITVNTGGSVSTMDGVNGTAISSYSGYTNLTNNGTITGSIKLSSGTITNNGTLYTGATVSQGIANNGLLNVGGPGNIATTSVAGGYTQGTGGTLQVDINALPPQNAPQKADLLSMTSGVLLQGTVAPVASNLLPGTYTILTGTGGVTLQAATTPSIVVNWNLAQSGNSVVLSPTANFVPQGVSLTPSESHLGNYLNNAWNNSDSVFAPVFARLSQMTSASQLSSSLDTLSAKATQAMVTAQANNAGAALGAPLSCPVFVDQGTLLGEDSCVWAKVTGQQTNQWTTSDTQGYQIAGVTYRIGGQHEIASNWYLGASFGGGQSWSTSSGGSSGKGQTFDGSVALKHTMGPWYIAGSFALAGSTDQTNRVLGLPAVGSMPAVNATLQSDQSIFVAGGRLRGAYEFSYSNWYVRPYGDLDVVYTNTPGFQETGPAGYALSVLGNSKTSVAISPMVEFGGRVNVDQQTILRPYLALGMSFRPNSTRYVDANVEGALAADGTFRTFMNSPDVLGNLDVGVQLYRSNGFEVKAEYDVEAGGSFLGQTGSARIAYHF